MQDSLKFRGEVIARNKNTGEVLFKRHNCIVEGGRLMTLAKAMGLNSDNLNDLSQAISSNADVKTWFENATNDSGDYKILFWKVGYDTTDGMPDLRVNTKATDISDMESAPWYLQSVDYFKKTDVQKDDIPVEYVDTYTWTDAAEDMMQPIINKTTEFDSLFIRYKLNLCMPKLDMTNIALDNDDPKSLGWHNIEIQDSHLTVPFITINELGLFMSSEDEKDDAERPWLLFSLLKFPPVTLQAEMEVEFEYRIYG